MPGELPQGWSWKRLGEHFTRINRRNVAGVRRVLTASGDRGLIDQEEFFNKRVAGADLSTYLHIKNGEFAYNRSAMAGYPVGAVKRLDRYNEGVVSSLYLCFGRSETATVDLDFAAQVLDSRVLEDELRPIAKVGARAHGLLNVSADDFMSVLFPTPPVPEQKKIASILASVDEAIQSTQAVVDQTRRVKEGLSQDLLTRGLPGHTRFKQTEIGEIPESWEIRRCENLSYQISVGIVVKPTQYYAETGVKCWRSANVGEGFVRDSDWVHISEEANRMLSKTRLGAGDVVVVRTGYPGTACVVPAELDQTNCVDLLFVRPRRDEILPTFLCYFINSECGKGQVLKGQGGLAQKHFNVGELNKMWVVVPPIQEQAVVVSRLDDVQRSIGASESQLAVLRSTKSGLLQDLLTGKVRVSP